MERKMSEKFLKIKMTKNRMPAPAMVSERKLMANILSKIVINTTCLDPQVTQENPYYSKRYTAHKFECNSKSKINSQKQFDASG